MSASNEPASRNIRIRYGLMPGDLGAIVHLHGVLYAREYGLDTTFEPYVAKPLADFALSGNGRIWIAEEDGRVIGSIAVIDDGQGIGQIRWFLLVPETRGLGLGRQLLDQALDYCRAQRMHEVFLWTFAELKDALRLYQKAGFVTVEEKPGEIWGGRHVELRMVLRLAPGP